MIHQGSEDAIYRLHDYQKDISNLDNEIKSAFADNILTQSEAEAIKKSCEIAYSQVANNYKALYANVKLPTVNKNALKTAYDNFTVSYNTLLSNIITVLNVFDIKSGSSDVDRANALKGMSNSYTDYKNKLLAWNTCYEDAVDALIKQVANDEANNAVNDIKIGGRNLALKSDNTFENNGYKLAEYYISPSEGEVLSNGYGHLVSGEVYTITIDITPAANVTFIRAYLSVGYSSPWLVNTDGTTNRQRLSNTAVAFYNSGKEPSNDPRYANVYLYRFPNNGTVTGNSIVHSIKIERGNKPTGWTPAPEDIQEQITTITDTVSGVSQKVDAAAKSITDKVWQTDINNTITTQVTPKLDDATHGINKWLIDCYDKSTLPSENQTKSTIEAIFGTGVAPAYTISYTDAEVNHNINILDNYIGHGYTFLYFDTSYTCNVTFSTIGNGSLYINGKFITETMSGTSQSISLKFTAGWNSVEVIYNTDAGNEGFLFTPKLATIQQCKLMNCHYGKITSREVQMIDKVVNTITSIDSIKTRLSTTETLMHTKADGTVVKMINEKLNNSIETFDSFSRTISATYATNDNLNSISSQVEQLGSLISTKVTVNEVSSLISQAKDNWKIDFAENGASCGSTTIDRGGIIVQGAVGTGYKTYISPTEFSGWYLDTKVFYLNQDETVTERLRVKKGLDLNTLKIVPAVDGTAKGIDFLSSNAIL